MSMLSSIPAPRKAKVNLTDYPFRRDIETRLLMAQLSVKEVDVLREVLHHSLTISITQLAEDVGVGLNEEDLLPILDKLEKLKIFKRQNMTLIVDKEMRKYFEIKIEKCDENFQPDLIFVQSILNKVPIHILPLWYAIPRSSNNIFESIIEKYFLTPTIYRQYLSELQFDHPTLQAIIQEVFRPPHFKTTVSHLMAKFDLTHECLEEYLLILEYHFICCLSYQQVAHYWREVVTPFAEWRDFLRFENETKIKPVQGPIQKASIEFQFIKDLTTLLHACQSKKFHGQDVKNLHDQTTPEWEGLIQKLIQMEFVNQSESGHLTTTEKGRQWLSKSIPEQVAKLANDPLNTLSNVGEFDSLWNIRNLHLIEKSLRRLSPNEWVEFDHFLEGFTAPIGEKEPVTLKNKGKKWKYVLPTYTDKEKQFIQAVIMERLMELGVIATGLFQGKLCFCLTLFGSQFIH
jgi:hypothetical protein